MFEDKQTASYINDLMLKMGKELNDSLSYVQSKGNQEEFEQYRLTVGKIMGEILLEIMNPIYDMHPDTKPDQLK